MAACRGSLPQSCGQRLVAVVAFCACAAFVAASPCWVLCLGGELVFPRHAAPRHSASVHAKTSWNPPSLSSLHAPLFTVACLASAASLSRLLNRRKTVQNLLQVVRAGPEWHHTADGPMMKIPDGRVPDEDKIPVPREIYEGTQEITDFSGPRPGGSSVDPDQTYFWKMTGDKKAIEVIVPVPDAVTSNTVIYRMGDDAMDVSRGPLLEVGYKAKNDEGRWVETLLVDGQILNKIERRESFWDLEEISGVKVIMITLIRPSRMRWKHDTVMQRKVQEERIDPQTWDALLVEERIVPKITQKVFMDITFSGEAAGRIEFGLYGDILPETTKNFVALCTGEYTDAEGNLKQSAFHYKGSKFQDIKKGWLMTAGNPGLDTVVISFTQEELEEYVEHFTDPHALPKSVGKVKYDWVIRWGADLGLGEDSDGRLRREGQALDSAPDGEEQEAGKRMKELVARGTGAKLVFYRPEWEMGCNYEGKTSKAENFTVPHMKRGMLSMNRFEKEDKIGSCFFILGREFPQMDRRWVAFGEIVSGLNVLEKMEEDFEWLPEEVKIADCGLIGD
eukprot:TRINITY_DN19995_c0_g1_i1.p1 TRINITY_DN19995_c0_g1~~TRINITY_DN19995_c0_g1_i1.p1  ORF type:complete len:562 (-),score=113.76 TRINITY_DN19995_c0_g1_i1:127-1812(-)